MMWLALPSPSGNPTTRLVPTSRMMSSAIASGSEKSFGIKCGPGTRWHGQPPWNRVQPPRAIAHLCRLFVCDEPATAKRRIHVLMSRGRLPVAAAPPKQVDVSRSSAGADGRGCYGITWLSVPLGLATLEGACFDRAFVL